MTADFLGLSYEEEPDAEQIAHVVGELVNTRKGRSFHRAYLGFCGARSVSAVQYVMEHSKVAIGNATRGLEVYCLHPEEKQAQKIRLMQQVQYFR